MLVIIFGIPNIFGIFSKILFKFFLRTAPVLGFLDSGGSRNHLFSSRIFRVTKNKFVGIVDPRSDAPPHLENSFGFWGVGL